MENNIHFKLTYFHWDASGEGTFEGTWSEVKDFMKSKADDIKVHESEDSPYLESYEKELIFIIESEQGNHYTGRNLFSLWHYDKFAEVL